MVQVAYFWYYGDAMLSLIITGHFLNG